MAGLRADAAPSQKHRCAAGPGYLPAIGAGDTTSTQTPLIFTTKLPVTLPFFALPAVIRTPIFSPGKHFGGDGEEPVPPRRRRRVGRHLRPDTGADEQGDQGDGENQEFASHGSLPMKIECRRRLARTDPSACHDAPPRLLSG